MPMEEALAVERDFEQLLFRAVGRQHSTRYIRGPRYTNWHLEQHYLEDLRDAGLEEWNR